MSLKNSGCRPSGQPYCWCLMRTGRFCRLCSTSCGTSPPWWRRTRWRRWTSLFVWAHLCSTSVSWRTRCCHQGMRKLPWVQMENKKPGGDPAFFLWFLPSSGQSRRSTLQAVQIRKTWVRTLLLHRAWHTWSQSANISSRSGSNSADIYLNEWTDISVNKLKLIHCI